MTKFFTLFAVVLALAFLQTSSSTRTSSSFEYVCSYSLDHGGKEVSECFRNRKTSIYFALKQNPSGVKTLKDYVLNESSNPSSQNYGKYLDIHTIQRMLQPDYPIVNQAREWIRQYIDMESCEFLGDSFRCTTDHLNVYLNNHIFKNYDNTVFDFIEYPMQKPAEFLRKTNSTLSNGERQTAIYVDPGYVTREVLLEFYNVPERNGKRGFVDPSQTSVGAMEYEGNDGFLQSDMTKAQVASGLKANPVSDEHLIGQNGRPDGESELDMAVIWWSAADASLWYEVFDGWMYGWAQDFMHRQERPQVVSLSWGWNEAAQCQITTCNNTKDYVERTNVEFMKLAAMGTTIVVSSGDAGSPGRTNELCDNNRNHINPVFPGGSPWVLSVGATYVDVENSRPHDWETEMCHILGCVNGTTQGITNYHATGWTSGSGFTAWDETPQWQKSHVEKYLNSGVRLPKSTFFNRNGRSYPDLSTFGHNCGMYFDRWTGEDGTSCSAPIMAGIIAYLNDVQQSRGKPTLGFANPLLYKMYEDNSDTFTDISKGNSGCTEAMCCQGDNFGFFPTKGMWDAVSGLGTPNIGNMVKYLEENV